LADEAKGVYFLLFQGAARGLEKLKASRFIPYNKLLKNLVCNEIRGVNFEKELKSK